MSSTWAALSREDSLLAVRAFAIVSQAWSALYLQVRLVSGVLTVKLHLTLITLGVFSSQGLAAQPSAWSH